MKISSLYRLQATKNSKVYQKDYLKYVKQREKDGEFDIKIGPPWDPRKHLSTAGKWLCKKWVLQFPIDPYAPLEPQPYPRVPGSSPEPLDNNNEKSKSELPSWMLDGGAYPVSFPIRDELKRAAKKADSDVNQAISHVDGKLCLLIDTSWPLDMIMNAFREFIEHYAQKTEARKRSPTADPWEVYSLHKRGMNKWKITKKLHQVSELPAYSKMSASLYQQVKRAYLKAKSMVELVETEAKKRSRLPKS